MVDAFRSVFSSSSSSDHQGGSKLGLSVLLDPTKCDVEPFKRQFDFLIGVLWLLVEFFSLTKVSSERSSLISSVLAMGAKPSGFELLPFEVETLGKMDGELAGEQSGVDFLSENKRKILFYFSLKKLDWRLGGQSGKHYIVSLKIQGFSWSWSKSNSLTWPFMLLYPLSNWAAFLKGARMIKSSRTFDSFFRLKTRQSFLLKN